MAGVDFRLMSPLVQEATQRWIEGQPLREIHELLEAAESPQDAQAAVAEAYVKGQAEMMPRLVEMREEIERLQPKVGGRGRKKSGAWARKLAGKDDIALLLAAHERHGREHPEWTRDELAREVAAELSEKLGQEVEYRLVRRRLEEVSQRPVASISFSMRPVTPLAAWILEGN